jgi:hypothetical protein
MPVIRLQSEHVMWPNYPHLRNAQSDGAAMRALEQMIEKFFLRGHCRFVIYNLRKPGRLRP